MSEPNTPYTLRGHEFHYRYAAIRVLQLLDPTSGLKSVSVEGAHEEVDGEDVCDFVEYYEQGRIWSVKDNLGGAALAELIIGIIRGY